MPEKFVTNLVRNNFLTGNKNYSISIFCKTFFLAYLFAFFHGKCFSANEERKSIDVVFCVDLSGSTNGLIDDMRDNLWDIINQVNSYRPKPDFRLGIVAFARPSFGKTNGYIKILSALTDDFEPLAYELANLKPDIEKGDQLVGAAIRTAVTGMNWTNDQDALKVIFLIGNGHVYLDGMKYKDGYELAAEKGIIINTVYCMSLNYKDEISGWREIAKNTGGADYELQVHKRNPLIITSKETDRLHSFAQSLSSTYIYYGKSGKEIFKMEDLIDRTALRGNEMAFQSRLFYKISDSYQLWQNRWDLVDYIKQTNSDLTEINTSMLPDSLKTYSASELKRIAVEKKQDRTRIINSIRMLLPLDRQQIINREIKEKEYDKNPNTLDRIIIGWLNAAATSKGLNTFVN